MDWNELPLAGGGLLLAHGRPPTFHEPDGSLRVLEFAALADYFRPARWFEIRQVPDDQTRADHAHRTCWQCFLPNFSAYRVEVMAPSGESAELRLDPWGDIVVVPPWRWVRVRGMLPEAVLSVIASHPYEPDDYVHSLDEFHQHGG